MKMDCLELEFGSLQFAYQSGIVVRNRKGESLGAILYQTIQKSEEGFPYVKRVLQKLSVTLNFDYSSQAH